MSAMRAGTVVSGAGTVSAAMATAGAATIMAGGGTLEVTGALNDAAHGLGLAVMTGAFDELKLDAGGTAQSLSFNGGSGTLELAAGAVLTLAVVDGTVLLDGGGAGIADAGGSRWAAA